MSEKNLAINGGEPIRDTYLQYGRQSINETDVALVLESLQSDYLTTGPLVNEFENKIANYVGAKYAVAVSNGTAALHMACFATDIKEGDEVLLSPITFVASSNAILYCGGIPVFVDINKDTYNIDIDKIEQKITKKTKAIIAVDFAGQSCDIDSIKKIADKYNLILIEDAAHALGSEYKGKKVGVNSDVTCFSFHPVKPITTAEGGIVTTNSEEIYKKMMMFRSHGITRDSNILLDNQGDWYYEQQFLGYNCRLPDIQSALGISQLNRIDEFIDRRRQIVGQYNKAFDNLDEVITPFEMNFSNSGWHIYVIQLKLEQLKASRKEIFNALRAENIGVNVHYIPVYLQPYYQNLGYKKGLCQNAEKFYERAITLPLFPAMTDKDISDVINAVKKVVAYYRK